MADLILDLGVLPIWELSLLAWRRLLLRVGLWRLLGHHLAGTAHVLEVCCHGEEGTGGVTILRRAFRWQILAQASDPAVALRFSVAVSRRVRSTGRED